MDHLLNKMRVALTVILIGLIIWGAVTLVRDGLTKAILPPVLGAFVIIVFLTSEPFSEKRRSSTQIGAWQIAAAGWVGLFLLVALGTGIWVVRGRPAQGGDLFETGRAVIFTFAAIGAVPAGYIAYRRQRTAEEQRDVDVAKHALEQSKENTRSTELKAALHQADVAALRTRFAEAASQLGSAHPAIRLAGVYAMAQLADDWGNDEVGGKAERQQCIDVLCGYLRLPTTGSVSDIADDKDSDQTPEGSEVGRIRRVVTTAAFVSDREVRRTILSVVRQHLSKGASPTWQGFEFNFSGAVFEELDLDGSRLREGKIVFDGAFFCGPKIRMRHLSLDRSEISFRESRLIECTIDLTKVECVNSRITFTGAEGSRLVTKGVQLKFNDSTFAAGSTLSFEGLRAGSFGLNMNSARVANSRVALIACQFDENNPSWITWDKSKIEGGAELKFENSTFDGVTHNYAEAEIRKGSRLLFLGEGSHFERGGLYLADVMSIEGQVEFTRDIAFTPENFVFPKVDPKKFGSDGSMTLGGRPFLGIREPYDPARPYVFRDS